MGKAVWRTARRGTLAPSEEQERRQYANQVGADGWMLLDALQAHSRLDENPIRCYSTTHYLGAPI